MSPRRRVAHPIAKRPDSQNLLIAGGTVVAVGVGTALAVWLIRPGGVAANQPRIATVLGGTLLVFLIGLLVARTPIRPIQGRMQYWTVVGVIVAVVVALGALVQLTTDWNWALAAGCWAAAIIIGVSLLGEAMFLIRRLASGNVVVGALFAVALAFILGAAGALLWPGGVRIERAPKPTIPSAPSSPSAPATTIPDGSVPTIPSTPLPSGQ